MKHPAVQRIVDQLLGKPAWQAKKGHGSFLTFEFGEPSLCIREPREASPDASEQVKAHYRRRLVTIRGEWHLWIYCCDWNIVQDGQLLSHNESPDEIIQSAVRRLDGQCLLGVSVDKDGSSEFTFDLGGVLKTTPYKDWDIEDQWLIYEPSRMVFSIQSGGTYSHVPGNTSLESEVKVPLFEESG